MSVSDAAAATTRSLLDDLLAGRLRCPHERAVITPPTTIGGASVTYCPDCGLFVDFVPECVALRVLPATTAGTR